MNEEMSEVPPELEEKLSELTLLQQTVEETKKRAADYYDQLLRLQAEFDNYRKRTEKEKTEARQWGKQDVLMPLLSLVDIFEQALAQAQHAKDLKQVVQGLGFLYKNFAGFLKDEGLAPIDVVGKEYDPHIAEAVEQVEVDDEEQVGKVLSEVQKGYMFHGKILLRPSRVRVGVAKASSEEPKKSHKESIS